MLRQSASPSVDTILVLESPCVFSHDQVIEPFVYDCHKELIAPLMSLYAQEIEHFNFADAASYSLQEIESIDFN